MAQAAAEVQTDTIAYPLDPETLFIPHKTAAELGAKFAEQYQSGKPFHYIGIDNFLPEPVVARVRDEALRIEEKSAQNSSAQEHLKAAYSPDELPVYTKAVFNALNSRSFIRFLEEMTGIHGLIPDPYYLGGGIHRTSNGGYLGVHADFNHHKHMNLERRLNVLVYLKPDWKEEYGGSFEIWSEDMQTRVAKYPPVMNRMCCFTTGSTSMHGNPDPVAHPEGQPRLSIALYYYTATWTDSHVAHSTLFRVRPGSADSSTRRNDSRRLMRKYLPPVLHPFAERVMNKLRL